jgi:hypothetical protein
MLVEVRGFVLTSVNWTDYQPKSQPLRDWFFSYFADVNLSKKQTHFTVVFASGIG